MNSFERIGESQLAAFEGQRQIAHAIATGMGRMFKRILRALGRAMPNGTFAPW